MKKISLALFIIFGLFCVTSCDLIVEEEGDKKDEIYTLTFEANGGSGSMEPIKAKEGESVTLPKNIFKKSGFHFIGWTYTLGSVEKLLEDEAILTVGKEDINLVAKWELIPSSVAFDANGGTGSMDSIELIQGESLTLPANSFTNSTLHFIEWNTDPQGNGTSYKDLSSLTMGDKNVVLYAQWGRLFITKWDVSTNKLKFPLNYNGTYDFTIDWGDGTESHITSGSITSINGQEYVEHIYEVNNEYTVKVLGTLKGFGFSMRLSGIHPDSYLLDVLEWGDIQLHNKGYQFYKANINFTAFDNPDLSNVTNMEHIFGESTVNKGIEDWNVSNVTRLMYAFFKSTLNADVSEWDVSSVTNMCGVFQYTTLNSDISKWDVSNVTNMYGMFLYNMSIANIDLSNWKTSKVSEIRSMFYGSAYNGDISMWDVSNVDDFSHMFAGATNFDCGGIDVSNWNWNIKSGLGADKFTDTFKATPLESNKPSWCK